MQVSKITQIIERFRKDDKLRSFLFFAMIGGTGIIINTIMLFLLSTKGGVNYLIASAIATETAIITNFLGNNFLTFRNQNADKNIFRKFLSFQLISLIALSGTVFLLWFFVSIFGEQLILIWNLIAITIMFIVNFILNTKFTWITKKSDKNIPENTSENIDKKNKDKLSEDLIEELYSERTESQSNISQEKTGKPFNKFLSIFFALCLAFIFVVAPHSSAQTVLDGNHSEMKQKNENENKNIQIQEDEKSEVNKNEENNNQYEELKNDQRKNRRERQDSNERRNQENTLNEVIDSITIETSINQIAEQITNQDETQEINQDSQSNENENEILNIEISNNPPIEISDDEPSSISTNTSEVPGNSTNYPDPIDIPISPEPIDTDSIIDTNNTANNISNNNSNLDNSSTNNTNNPPSNSSTNISNPINQDHDNTIIKHNTSLELKEGNTYFMREDSSATFSVELNQTGTVTWLIDGEVQNVEKDINVSEFIFNPGILWSPRPEETTIINAKTNMGEVTWFVNVDDVINPFFTAADDNEDIVGSTDTKIHILTSNNYVNFENLRVILTSSLGSTEHNLTRNYQDEKNSEWTKHITRLDGGDNYISEISGYDTISGKEITYTLPKERAHYVKTAIKERSRQTDNEEKDTNSSGPQLIYALFNEGIVPINNTQTIQLDAKNFKGGISEVEAKLITPRGRIQNLNLTLTQGTKEYGTWTGSFISAQAGIYQLSAVTLIEKRSTNKSSVIKIQNVSYYSLDRNAENNFMGENLSLIYTALSHSEADNGTQITINLDARDSSGISSVWAGIETIKGANISQDNFIVELSLLSGKSTYGSWQGTFNVTEPDTTYTLKYITLKNEGEEKKINVSERSTYVHPIQEENILQSRDEITGFFLLFPSLAGATWPEIIRKPLAPTILGFLLMIALITAFISANRKKEIKID